LKTFPSLNLHEHMVSYGLHILNVILIYCSQIDVTTPQRIFPWLLFRLTLLNFFVKIKRREHFQKYFMRSEWPRNQNYARTLQEKKITDWYPW
jgi:hypothetical protein